MAAAQVLRKHGAEITLIDSKSAIDIADQIKHADQLGIPYITDCNRIPDYSDLVITSPGVRKSAEILVDAQSRNIEIWSEIEAAYQISKAPIIAVTGTNGKTTTVALLGEIGKAAGYKTFVAGNIAAGELAMPLINACDQASSDDLIIAEISSFQLEWIKDFRPKVSVITNITSDHSDRQTWDEYVAAKWRIAENQGAGDTLVIRSDVPEPMSHLSYAQSPDYRVENKGVVLSEVEGSQRKSFQPEVEGSHVRHPDRSGGNTTIYFDHLARPDWLNHLLIPGEHNRENAMAALTAARSFGIADDFIRDSCLAFKGVVHRLEFVQIDSNNVTWINNSMCTNNDAFVRSLEAIVEPKIVISGGVYKGGDISLFGKAASMDSVKSLICFGKSGQMLADTAKEHGAKDVHVLETLQESVTLANSLAVSDDTVILSPACASFDQFRDFEDRGEQFKKLVFNKQKN
jgi:UDP-N-acetylmuramoylalanine--D-glutamate ligase